MQSQTLRRTLKSLKSRATPNRSHKLAPLVSPVSSFTEAPLESVLHARDWVESGAPAAHWAGRLGVTEELAMSFESMMPRPARPDNWIRRFNAEPAVAQSALRRSFKDARRQINRLQGGSRLDALALFAKSMQAGATWSSPMNAAAHNALAVALKRSRTAVTGSRSGSAPVRSSSGLGPSPAVEPPDLSSWWPHLVLLATAQARLGHPPGWWPKVTNEAMNTVKDTLDPRKQGSSATKMGGSYLAVGTAARGAPQLRLERERQASQGASGHHREEQQKTPTFEQYYHEWRAELTATKDTVYSKSVSDVFTYHLLSAFGHVDIGAIRREDILQFGQRLANRPAHVGDLIPATAVSGVMQHLDRYFNSAATRYGITSPTAGIVPPLALPPYSPRPFTVAERELIIRQAPVEHRPYLRTRFATGMTTGEVHALLWENVDLPGQTIRVKEVLVKGKLTPCHPASRRDIPISQNLALLLAQLHQNRRPDTEWVFQTPKGTPIQEDEFTAQVWNPLLARLKLYPRPLNSIRESTVVRQLEDGRDPASVARICGYTDMQVFLRLFERSIPAESLSRKT